MKIEYDTLKEKTAKFWEAYSWSSEFKYLNRVLDR